MSVVILYGTETGNSELVADAIADVLTVEHDPSIYDMSEFAVDDLDPSDFLIIVCSTYGEGELPTGAEPFAEEITETTPNLSGIRFAVFGLGDTIYGETFNRGGELMAELLTRKAPHRSASTSGTTTRRRSNRRKLQPSGPRA